MKHVGAKGVKSFGMISTDTRLEQKCAPCTGDHGLTLHVPKPKIMGVILEGSRSSRFRSNKAAALLGEKSMLYHVCAFECIMATYDSDLGIRVIRAGAPEGMGEWKDEATGTN